jgi:hypothetical protein
MSPPIAAAIRNQDPRIFINLPSFAKSRIVAVTPTVQICSNDSGTPILARGAAVLVALSRISAVIAPRREPEER